MYLHCVPTFPLFRTSPLLFLTERVCVYACVRRDSRHVGKIKQNKTKNSGESQPRRDGKETNGNGSGVFRCFARSLNRMVGFRPRTFGLSLAWATFTGRGRYQARFCLAWTIRVFFVCVRSEPSRLHSLRIEWSVSQQHRETRRLSLLLLFFPRAQGVSVDRLQRGSGRERGTPFERRRAGTPSFSCPFFLFPFLFPFLFCVCF